MPTTRPPPRVLLLHIAAIAVVTLLAYGGSFDGEFVSDDTTAIRDNPLIRSVAWSHVKRIFTTFDDSNYIPLKVLSLAADYRLWGPEPWGFHTTNLLLHVGAALLIYATLLRLGTWPVPACLTALLWAVHPLQVESVAWMSERKNVLSGFFFFATFYAYLDYSDHRRTRAYVAVLALYVLALLSKMNTMVLPAIFLAYEATYRFRLRAADAIASLPFFVIGIAVAGYNLAGNPIHGAAWHAGSVIVTWLTSSVVIFGYLRRLILPTDLRPWYDVRLRDSLADPAVLLSLLGLGAIAAATTWLVRRRHRASFWILWFFITLAPMLNIVVPLRVLMQDRYMYLALLGPLALAASVLADVARRAAARTALPARAAAVAAVAAVVACTILTYRQVEIWASPFTLWRRGSEGQAWLSADPVYKGDDYDAQVAYLEDAVGRDPSSAVLRNNLGAFYFSAGRIEAALPEFEAAARLAPDDPVVLTNLGRVHAYAGRHAEAAALLERALVLDPYSAVARFGLLRVYLDQGDAAAAGRELAVYARLFPDRYRSPIVSRELARLARLERAGPTGAGR